MRQRPSVVVLGGWLVFGMAACAEPPAPAVDAARERLNAVAAEGAVYAPTAYAAAEETAAQLEAELQAQNDRFGPLRSYDRVNELVVELETAAAATQTAIETEKERLQTEAASMVADAEQALANAREELQALPEEEAEPLLARLASVEASLADVDSALAGGSLEEAFRQAETGLAEASDARGSVARRQAEIREAEEAEVERAARGGIQIPRRVLVDGQELRAGLYQVRLTDESAPPVGDEPADSTRWVEFVSGGTVAARGLAVVVPDAGIGEIAESQPPRNSARVDDLREGDYVRLWLHRDGVNYLVHMPSAPR